MTKRRFDKLKSNIAQGADLYISLDGAILSNFEELTGIKIVDSYTHATAGYAEIDGKKIRFSTNRTLITRPAGAKVLVSDSEGNPLIYENKYGKGRVFVITAPIEKELLDAHNADYTAYANVYRKLAGTHTDTSAIKSANSSLIYTLHPTEDGYIVILLNHTENALKTDLVISDTYRIEKLLYGSTEQINAFDACILKIKRA